MFRAIVRMEEIHTFSRKDTPNPEIITLITEPVEQDWKAEMMMDFLLRQHDFMTVGCVEVDGLNYYEGDNRIYIPLFSWGIAKYFGMATTPYPSLERAMVVKRFLRSCLGESVSHVISGGQHVYY